MAFQAALPGRNLLAYEIPTVTVRPLQPEDAGNLYLMHERLSLESLYARYLYYRRPQPDEIAAISAMPAAKGTGVVATVTADGPKIVGMAYYLRDTAQADATAELGMLVEDDYQGLGIGRLLCFAIGQRARALKVEQLRVRFHPSNYRVLRMIQSSGYRYQAGMRDGLNDFTIFLKSEQGRSFLRQLWHRTY